MPETIEGVLLLQNAFSHYRMRSLTTEGVLCAYALHVFCITSSLTQVPETIEGVLNYRMRSLTIEDVESQSLELKAYARHTHREHLP